jgi:hypothetical protein
MQAPLEVVGVRLGGGREAAGLKPSQDEAVQIVAGPSRVIDGWYGGPSHWPQGPDRVTLYGAKSDAM